MEYADHLAVLNMPMDALKRSATVTSFDPLTLLPALSMVTKHPGLIATASTTFEPPYLIARRFASLDHITGGRAGWNVVTTSNPEAALNFGMSGEMEHGERYRRAREFVDVVWNSERGRTHTPSRRIVTGTRCIPLFRVCSRSPTYRFCRESAFGPHSWRNSELC